MASQLRVTEEPLKRGLHSLTFTFSTSFVGVTREYVICVHEEAFLFHFLLFVESGSLDDHTLISSV